MENQPRALSNTVLVAGDFIERKYRVVRLLDEGGMGCVYHAVQEPLGRDVAVKVLKPLTNEVPEKREQRHRRFLREASLSSRLKHPNTVVIFDYGELDHDRGFFFVMEFLEGISLRELLCAGNLDVSTAVHIAIQIASSLAEAHANGVIHRDLKPPNIMLVERGDDPHFVKVVDFGLVKNISKDAKDYTLTEEHTFIGSPLYMAPERFLSTTPDSPAVDIYALGVILYEMLAGRPPFIRDSDSTLHKLILEHAQVDPPPIHSFKPELTLPDGLEALVMKCLAKHPEHRFKSMNVIVRLLNRCLSEQESKAPAVHALNIPLTNPPSLKPFIEDHLIRDGFPETASNGAEAFREPTFPPSTLKNTSEHTLRDISSNLVASEARPPMNFYEVGPTVPGRHSSQELAAKKIIGPVVPLFFFIALITLVVAIFVPPLFDDTSPSTSSATPAVEPAPIEQPVPALIVDETTEAMRLEAEEALEEALRLRAERQLALDSKTTRKQKSSTISAPRSKSQVNGIEMIIVERNTPQQSSSQSKNSRPTLHSARHKEATGDYAGAVEDCHSALANGEIDCHVTLGSVYYKIGNIDRACHHFEAYKRLKPNDAGRLADPMKRLGC